MSQDGLMWHPRNALCLAILCFSSYVMAASPEESVDAQNLSLKAKRYTVECPPPGLASCAIKKPVGTGYRLLSTGTLLEDHGDVWIADFGRSVSAKKDATGKSLGAAQGKVVLTILGARDDLHEIEVVFAKPTVNPSRSKPPVNKTAASKVPVGASAH